MTQAEGDKSVREDEVRPDRGIDLCGTVSPRGEICGHTPGPWSWDSGAIPPGGHGDYADIYVDAGETIVATFNNCIREGQANARLIAAAPDLLAAARLGRRIILAMLIDAEQRGFRRPDNHWQRRDLAAFEAVILHATGEAT